MAINGDIVRRRKHIAAFPGVQRAGIKIILIEIPVQVKIFFIGRLHDGIIDVGIRNGDPAHKVVIQFIKRLIFRQDRGLCGDWICDGFSGCRRIGEIRIRRCGSTFQALQILVYAVRVLSLHVIISHINGAEQKYACKQDQQGIV